MRKIVVAVIALISSATASGDDALPPRPPLAPQRPVVDDYFGTKLTDPYRWMEALDAETLDWMRAQGRYTRAVLDSIPARAAFAQEVSDFTGGFGTVQSFQVVGSRTFYRYRAPGSNAFDLMVRERGRSRKLVDVGALATGAGANFAINYFTPSPDGARVALGISRNGSENADLTVLDVASGKTVAGPVSRAVFAGVSWTTDGRGLYFNRLAAPVAGRDPYLDSTANYWDLVHEPLPLPLPVEVEPQAFPYVNQWRGAPQAALVINNGVQFELETWLAPRDTASKPGANWRRLTSRDDAVTAIEMSGDHVFLLSHRDAPTYQVLALRNGQSLSDAVVLLPAEPRRVIESIHAAKDALYVVSRDGVYSHLLRVPLSGGAAREIALPFAGDLTEVATSSDQPGVSLMLQSWVVPPTAMHFDPATARLTLLALDQRPAYDLAAYRLSSLDADAKDGVKVPLTLVQKGTTDKPAPTLLYGYGAYGLSTLPQFRAYQIPLMEHGVASAFCHVRGGGELGEAWHLAGKDANKPNSWRDLIACAESLVARGVTTPKLLFLRGGSAGGVLVSRAMEERPDLFAGVIAQVPDANVVRIDVEPGGAANFPEVGSPKDPQGFRNLLMGDAFHHVERGVQYPPIMITTGLNDARVAPWLPAKFAAQLQASDTRAPVLLRVDELSGHGQGSTRSQVDELFIDIGSFMFWQAGLPGWQPAKNTLPSAP